MRGHPIASPGGSEKRSPRSIPGPGGGCCADLTERRDSVDPASPRRGFSLVELLIVLSLMSVMAALMLPSISPSIHEQLRSAAHVVAADLAYAQNLAVTNGTSYRFDFDLANNRYTLQHSGPPGALDTLPPFAFRSSKSTPTQQVVDLGSLPQLGGGVRLVQVASLGSSPKTETTLEYGPLGSTTRAAETVVWLAVGGGASQRFIAVVVNPVTGLAEVSTMQAVAPGSPAYFAPLSGTAFDVAPADVSSP